MLLSYSHHRINCSKAALKQQKYNGNNLTAVQDEQEMTDLLIASLGGGTLTK